MGTAYGDEIIFTALSGMSTLTTAEVTEVTDSQAKTGGNITDDGGLEITVRGVCWSTKPAPTVNDNKTDDGRGTGTFTSIISGLWGGTVYYVRAYSTNSLGITNYGNKLSFQTEYSLLNMAPGNLEATIAALDEKDAVTLKLPGTIDQRDFLYMRDWMQNLADIDLKDVTVAAYHEYPANTVPTNAFYIGDNNPKLQSIVLPDNITAIGTNAFMRSIGLKSLPVIPGGVKDIGLSAFRGCTGLRGTITLGSGVSKTGAYAFFNCLGCTGALVIPSGVTEIGDGAFQYCRGISHIVVNNPTPIPYTAEILPLYKEVLVPAASVEDYKALEEWKKHVINSL